MGSASRENTKKDLLFLGTIIVIGLALILYLMLRPDPDAADRAGTDGRMTHGATPVQAPDPTNPAPVERRQPNDPLAIGDPKAPVALVIFSDYRCPFCAKFSRDTEPELVSRFVDTGQLRIEWRDFPIFGEQSMAAARAGRAAGAQGKFWEFNRTLFAASPERGHPDLTEDVLLGFARQAGVPDMDRFATDMRSTTHDVAINVDLSQGRSIGVPSTPAFLINDTPLLGAQPTEVFVTAISDAVGAQ